MELVNELTSSHSNHVQPSSIESDKDGDDSKDEFCDSTTLSNFDRPTAWSELSYPEQKMVIADGPVGDGYPHQSCWV